MKQIDEKTAQVVDKALGAWRQGETTCPQTKRIGTNTAVVYQVFKRDDGDDRITTVVDVWLHGNCVATLRQKRNDLTSITLSARGWYTLTTCARLNAVVGMFGYSVRRKGGEYVLSRNDDLWGDFTRRFTADKAIIFDAEKGVWN